MLRKALRAAYPETRFSVRMSRGTGYGTLHVSWSGGPSEKDVHPILAHFEGASFNPMTDSTVYKGAVWDDDLRSFVRFNTRFILPRRS